MTIQSYMLQLRVKIGGGMHKKSRQLVMNQRSFFLKIGRGDRTRTCDSLVPNQERYQLRYTSLPESGCKGTKKKSKRAIKGKKNATAQQSLTIQPCDSSYFLLFCCFDIPLFDNTLLDENLLQGYHRAVYLLLGVGGHEGVNASVRSW